MARTKLDEGKVLRGYLIRLYPTDDQARMLRAMQLELMLAWNVLVTSRETHVEHCVRAAEDAGLVVDPPERPLEDAPDEVWAAYRKECGERKFAALQAMLPVEGYRWEDWRVDYKTVRNLFGGKKNRSQVTGHRSQPGKDPDPSELSPVTCNLPSSSELSPVTCNLSPSSGSLAPAQAYTALVERFRKTKGARPKRHPLEMPLQIKSGHLWKPDAEGRSQVTGDRLQHGSGSGSGPSVSEPRNPGSPATSESIGVGDQRFPNRGTSIVHDAEPAPGSPSTSESKGVASPSAVRNPSRGKGTLSFAGMKIRGQWWREPEGYFIEGASIKIDDGKWFASLKCKVPERTSSPPTLGPIGVNLGLKVLVALSTGKIWPNPRGNQYTDRVARWSEQIDGEEDPNRKVDLARGLKRYQARFERKTRHLILTEILPALAPHSEIVVARGIDGLQTAAQGVQCRLSKNRLGGYTSSMGEVLRQISVRYGVRVREVEWSWISQQCSQCGHYDEKRYQRGYLRDKEKDYCRCPNPRCPSEGLLQHVDVNAARNALGRPSISQVAAE